MRLADLVAAVEREGRAAVVLVAGARGSVPREAGAAMLVTASGARGTIGGGAVEHRAIGQAREMLNCTSPLHDPPPQGGREARKATAVQEISLGPALDQCCGGHMRLAFAVLDVADLPRLRAARGTLALWEGGPVVVEDAPGRPVLVYGAGHVGRALVRALSPLPFAVRWIDARRDGFPEAVPEGVETLATPLPEAAARAAPGEALHVVLTHSHALDLEIVTSVLERGEFGFLGLIGSATKRRVFLRRLRERGVPEARLARLTCPIGVPGVRDKRPEVIAAAVAAQLLQVSAANAHQTSRETA
ncbi:MAG TPA: xanthine dehydrogenase accessory protein XdhC [Thermohalobaculum sp.]|nr:xanthine dehydrogenase accessory protein XdhC [Thermohalobaculum sp.]